MNGPSRQKRIKILYVITLSEIGGAQKYLYYHLKYLDRSVFEPVLAAGQNDWLFQQAEELRIETHRCKHLVRPINPVDDFKTFIELLKIIRSVKPDIVHCNSSKAGIIGRIAAWTRRVPVIVFTAHGWAFTEGVNKRNRMFYTFLERMVAKITTRIIAVSEYDYALSLRYAVTGKDNIVVIKNGVEFPNENAEEERKKYRDTFGFDDSTLIVTMVSRLFPPKDPRTFLHLATVNRDRNALFLLVGGGAMRKELEAAVMRSDLRNIELMGDRGDVNRILMASDIFCFFSNWEGLPLAVIEAMAAGLPIIANPVGGVPELVKDGVNGYLVDKDDIDLVNSHMQILLQNSELRKRMGNESRNMYRRFFTAERMVQETESLYRELLADRAGRATG